MTDVTNANIKPNSGESVGNQIVLRVGDRDAEQDGAEHRDAKRGERRAEVVHGKQPSASPRRAR